MECFLDSDYLEEDNVKIYTTLTLPKGSLIKKKYNPLKCVTERIPFKTEAHSYSIPVGRTKRKQ